MGWLNKYPDKYKDGGKYPQVGPADWMNEHGWCAQQGGPTKQWELPNSGLQVTDYGSMYN